MWQMELKQLLTDLIAIDSTSALSNEPVIAYIEKYFESSDVSCHRLPAHEEGKYNVLLVKGDPSVEGLTLCGHMDTVPATPENWQSDPWALTERKGNWYARGSCDMKGFVAIAMQAIERAQVTSGCLAVLLVCDEELGSFGAKYILENGIPIAIPTQVIIGEPTSLQVVRLHKGHLSMQISIEGVSAHTGSPHLGENALVAGGKVICALADLSKKYESLQTDCSEHFPEVAKFPVLTTSTMNSGSAINVVPASCEIGVGLRLLPDQKKGEVVQEIHDAIGSVCDLPWTLEELGDNPSMLTPESSKVNHWLCSYIEQTTSVGVSYGTDGGYLSRGGYECVLYGAGDIAVAHKPDEFVPISEMQTCVATIDAAVQHFCGESE
jgi:acetylornithine deacetylase